MLRYHRGPFCRPSRWIASILITLGMVMFLRMRSRSNSPSSFQGTLVPEIQSAADGNETHWQNQVPNVLTSHPIERLWAAGHARFQQVIANQSKTADEAFTEYMRRYGRFPPPGFQEWVDLALRHDFLLVDEFDLMTNQLSTFSRFAPQDLNKQVNDALRGARDDLIEVQIRNHRLHVGSIAPKSLIEQQLKSILSNKEYLNILPDMKLLFNILDEPKVAVPSARLDRTTATLPKDEYFDPETGEPSAVHFLDLGQIFAWAEVQPSCPEVEENGAQELPSGLHFASGPATLKSLCEQTDVADLHGLFMRPQSLILTHSMVPIWSQAKPPIFQDLVYPSPYYIAKSDDYDPSMDVPWNKKDTTLYWTGSTTGGHATSNNWRRLHRQRFLLKTMPHNNEKPVPILKETSPGTWEGHEGLTSSLRHLFTTRVTNIVQCESAACDEQYAAFHLAKPSNQDPDDDISFSAARDPITSSYLHKYVLDLDGNSFSGRFHRLLHSKSAVIKQTMFQEWHDDWLIPWVHYIPLTMQGDEIWEVMRWLGTTERGDQVGQSIAEEGFRWANRVLRKVDMELVLVRLLLEYARLMDEGG